MSTPPAGGPPPADPADPADAAAAKRALRHTIRAARRERRDEVDASRRRDEEAGRLADVVLDRARALGADTVAAFESLPTEPPTERIVAALLGDGRRVLVPEMLADRDLTWRAVERPGVLGPDLGREAIGRAGLVLVPAVAVDAAGGRLGQGGGSYDRALVRVGAGAVLAGVVHDPEFVAGPLPTQPHDRALRAVVTATRGWIDLPARPGP